MANAKNLIDSKGEVRELQAADLRKFKPASEVLPTSLQAKLGVRGRQVASTKERITIRLSPDVVESFRAMGAGWQACVDAVLKEWLKTHKPV